MRSVRFTWPNVHKSFGQLRHDPVLVEHMQAQAANLAIVADRIAGRDDDYMVRMEDFPDRAVAMVVPAHPHAMNSNAKHNVLLKAVGEVSQ